MKKMILWTIVLFTPLLWTTTTHAIFGLPDVAALAQRVTIIANQGIQIGHAVSGLSALNDQFDKLKEQYDHIRQSTLGEVGKLTTAFADLSALPGQLVGTGLGWRDDFANTDTAGLVDALEVFSTDGTPLTGYWRDRLRDAPAVTEHEVLAEYRTLPVSLAEQAADNYRRQRAEAEQRTALSYSVNTAASSATATVASARDSYQQLRAQSNTSGTALQQAQVAGMITTGEVMAALVQLQAFEATQDAADALAAEQRRREREAARVATQRAARAEHERRLAGIAAHRDGGDELRFRVQ